MAEFNLFSDDIKFTCEYNKDIISFLDLKVTSLNGKLITSLYSKPIDCHQYLHYGSCHTKHTKRSIVYRPLRIKRVCSQESDFNEHSLNLRSWILKRGYPEKIINAEMSKVKFNVDNKRSNNRQKKEISFTQKFKVLQNIINTHLYLLCMNNEVKRVCTPKPMVSFRGSRKISSYLEQNYILLKEQWAHLDVGLKVVKSVNTSLKLILFLVVSLEKHIKLIIV